MKKIKIKLFLNFLTLSIILTFFMSGITIVDAKDSTAEIVIDGNYGRILYEHNSTVKMPMASTTKIVTCLTVIENFDLKKEIEIKKEYTNIEGSSIYLREGEIFKVEELLYGLMLRSGNDCAVALAKGLCKNEEDFYSLMMDTALKAGAINSSFKNPHGLHDNEHYTTAYDLAKITMRAMKNDIFKKIVSTKEIVIGKGESVRRLINKNKMLKNYQYSTGVKTGYTKKAGRCLVSSSRKDGFELISVVLNCGPMYERSKELLEKSYENFKNVTLLKKGQCVGSFTTSSGKTIPCYVNKEISYPLKNDELKNIKKIVKFNKNIKTPVNFNKECGTIEFYLAKQLLFKEKIYTIIE